jgi:Dockerin type I domain
VNHRMAFAQLALVLIAVTAIVLAEDLGPGTYDLSWNTVDDGGGKSAGGIYALAGTIGQADASTTILSTGAYAIAGGFWRGVIQSCQADVNADNVVNIDDLLAVINAWGSTGGPADVNGDHVVNIDDLLIVINAWGMCPRDGRGTCRSGGALQNALQQARAPFRTASYGRPPISTKPKTCETKRPRAMNTGSRKWAREESNNPRGARRIPRSPKSALQNALRLPNLAQTLSIWARSPRFGWACPEPFDGRFWIYSSPAEKRRLGEREVHELFVVTVQMSWCSSMP